MLRYQEGWQTFEERWAEKCSALAVTDQLASVDYRDAFHLNSEAGWTGAALGAHLDPKSVKTWTNERTNDHQCGTMSWRMVIIGTTTEMKHR
jgi:hypothetical protein